MSSSLSTKTEKYEGMLADALAVASVAPRAESPLAGVATEHLEMAEGYLADGRHFAQSGDLPNALAAYAYGHGWLDAAVRTGLLDVPHDTGLFAIE